MDSVQLAKCDHAARIARVAGLPEDIKMEFSEAAKLICEEIDTYLWQTGVHTSLNRAFRMDHIPNIDPLELLFQKLPPPDIDDLNMPFERQFKLDKAFVTILWSYCNSELDNIVKLSENSFAGDIWWMGRIAFSLGDREDYNSIKNYFLQLFGALAPAILQGEEPADVTGKRIRLYAQYCLWIGNGRKDDDSVIGSRFMEMGLMDEFAVNKNYECSACGTDIQGNVKLCTTCTHPHYKAMNAVRVCSEECLRNPDLEHKEYCKKRKFFFRAVELFEAVAHKFEVATFTGFARAVAIRDNNRYDTCIVPDATEKDLWTGASVFSEEAQRIVRGFRGREHLGLIYYDMGPDLYMQLKPLIFFTFKGFCDQISIIHAYVRNAPKTVDVSDKHINAKAKHPMFHPHSVLYLRLIGSHEDFVLDLHAMVFGWHFTLVPYKVFVQCRLACIVRITDMYGDEHQWADKEELGLRLAREEALHQYKSCIREFNKAISMVHGGPCFSFYQIAHVLPDRYYAYRDMIFSRTDVILAQITKIVRESGKFRLYFVFDANPYANDFRFGVTVSQAERDFYSAGVWMTDEEYDKQVLPYKQRQDVGDATRELAKLCFERLETVSAAMEKEAEEEAAKPTFWIGTSDADAVQIGKGMTAESVRQVRENWRNWQGPRLFTGELGQAADKITEMLEKMEIAKQEAEEEAAKKEKEKEEAEGEAKGQAGSEEDNFGDKVQEAKLRHLKAMSYFEGRLALAAVEKKDG